MRYSPLASLSFGLFGLGAESLKEIVPRSSILNSAASGPPVIAKLKSPSSSITGFKSP